MTLLHIEEGSGSNSGVECQLPKLDVAGSNPVSRSRSRTLALESFLPTDPLSLALPSTTRRLWV